MMTLGARPPWNRHTHPASHNAFVVILSTRTNGRDNHIETHLIMEDSWGDFYGSIDTQQWEQDSGPFVKTVAVNNSCEREEERERIPMPASCFDLRNVV